MSAQQQTDTETGEAVALVSGATAIAISIVAASVGVIVVLRWILHHRVRSTWAKRAAKRCAPPSYIVAGTAAAKISLAQIPALGPDGERISLGSQLFGGHDGGAQHFLLLVLIASVTWLGVQVVYVFTNALLRRITEQHGEDSVREKRARTQVMLLQRVVAAVAAVVGVGAMLFTWTQVRAIGAGLLASAGVAGVIAGFAAQRALGNLFSGLQLAFSDMLHVDDVVVVEGEWGQVERLTLSYVTIQIWDGRRLVLPVSYFTQTPFENWTKKDSSITGTVFLRVDWLVPVEELREHLHKILLDHPLWDRKDWSLVVTDVTHAGLVEVRASMGSSNGFTSWTLTCHVRERLVAYIRDNYPEALPRMRAEVAGAPGTGSNGRSDDGRAAKVDLRARPE